MAAPVPATTSTATTASSSLVITNPSGLATNDYIVAFVIATGASIAAITPPAGWTTRHETGSGTRRTGLFTRLATAGDVSGGSMTFTSGGSAMCGSLHRVTGAAIGSEYTSHFTSTVAGTSSPSFTPNQTPAIADTLVFQGYLSYDGATSGQATASAYASTPSNTWTELADINVDSGAIDPCLSIAYTAVSSVSQLTAMSCTLSVSKDTVVGYMLLLRAPTNTIGTNALLSVSPSFFSESGSAGTIGTNALLSVSPTIPAQSGRVDVMSDWQNETKPTTDWDNETL